MVLRLHLSGIKTTPKWYLDYTSAFFKALMSICTVSSNDRPVILPSFSYIAPKQAIAAL